MPILVSICEALLAGGSGPEPTSWDQPHGLRVRFLHTQRSPGWNYSSPLAPLPPSTCLLTAVLFFCSLLETSRVSELGTRNTLPLGERKEHRARTCCRPRPTAFPSWCPGRLLATCRAASHCSLADARAQAGSSAVLTALCSSESELRVSQSRRCTWHNAAALFCGAPRLPA